jgi:hypothetical protein
MSDTLPRIQPAYAPQPSGVPWPTTQWPRATHPRQAELEAVVNEAFTMDDLAVTNAVVVIQGGRVLIERCAGVKEFFENP